MPTFYKKMIQQKTILNVLDNSGAKKVKCIKVLGGFQRKVAGLGDIIVVSVQQLRNKNKQNSKLRKGSVVRALIVKTNKKLRKINGSFFKTSDNSVVLINKQGNILGTRILTALPKMLKKKKFMKLLSLCPLTY